MEVPVGFARRIRLDVVRQMVSFPRNLGFGPVPSWIHGDYEGALSRSVLEV